jgi:hypothetical protein
MESASLPPGGTPAVHTTGRVRAVASSAPGVTWHDKLELAALRSLRTFFQGAAGAFPAAGAGTVLLTASYWQAFAFALLAAGIAAGASFLQNIASFLPQDPTQKPA